MTVRRRRGPHEPSCRSGLHAWTSNRARPGRDDRRILEEIEGVMNAKRNTPEGDRLDLVVTLVEAWEAKHDPLDLGNAR
jgi:hypothetical protein